MQEQRLSGPRAPKVFDLTAEYSNYMHTIQLGREGYGADGPRAAVALDLENLLFGYRDDGDLEGGLDVLGAALADIRRRATVVMSVGVCDRVLAQQVAVPLAAHGVRVFPHAGGVDRADLLLIDRLSNELPASCDLVVVGSGDHIFAPAVATV